MEEKEPYFQVPKSLFRLRRNGGISLTAFDIYVLMLDRYKLSKKNKWKDEEGIYYIVYSYDDLLENLYTKNKNRVAEALKELESLNFLKKRKRYRKSTLFYLKNESNQKDTLTQNESNQKDTLTQNESNQKDTTRSNQKVTFIIQKNTQKNIENNEEIKGKIALNKNNYNKNNINNSKNNNVIDPALKNEIHLLLRGRDIKANQITKICIDIQRIKEVIDYANKNNKGNGFIIKALKENWKLGLESQASNNKENKISGLESQADVEKDYNISIDEVLRGAENDKKY